MRRSHSGFGSWRPIQAATDELKAGARSHRSSTDDAGPASGEGGLDAVMPSRNCPTWNEWPHVLQSGDPGSFRVVPTHARIYTLIRDKVLGFDWSWSTDRAILAFHWLFTLKILYLNNLLDINDLLRADITDVVTFSLSVLAVLSLLWHSRKYWPVSSAWTAWNPAYLDGLQMNAVFLTAATFLRLWMGFPFSINHHFLEFYISLLLLILNTKWGKGEHNYAVISKLYLSVWSISAIQKLVHGRFLNGESFMFAWDSDSRTELGDALETVRATVPNIEVHQLFIGIAVVVFLSELLLPLFIVFNPQKRFLWYGMFVMQFGVWLGSGEWSFALTGFALCFLGLTGPNAPVRSFSPVPKAVFIVLVLWPFLHMGLSNAYGFSPWRLGGWGMFSTPHFVHEYKVEFKVGDQCYSLREIPWSPDQYRELRAECDLCIEFNSERARERMEDAFRDILASKYRSDARVIRVRRETQRKAPPTLHK